tara:strand:- start:11221 stop:12879 length:1659 start_codon:yes stop_codon:yes gene_type:complete
MSKLLDIQGLRVHFDTLDGPVEALHSVSLSVNEGEIMGVVGESGCGKSVTSLVTIGLATCDVDDGSITFDGDELIQKTPQTTERTLSFLKYFSSFFTLGLILSLFWTFLEPIQGLQISAVMLTAFSICFVSTRILDAPRSKHEKFMRSIRGNKISMIFQEPMTALNPLYTVEKQVAEVLKQHNRLDEEDANTAIKIGKAIISPAEMIVDFFRNDWKGALPIIISFLVILAIHQTDNADLILGLIVNKYVGIVFLALILHLIFSNIFTGNTEFTETTLIEPIGMEPVTIPSGIRLANNWVHSNFAFILVSWFVIIVLLWIPYGVLMTIILSVAILTIPPIQISNYFRLDSAHTRQVVKILKEVKIPNPESVVKMYPHELSGGMRQRVMIAMMMACEPKLLIADEPTTALDVTIQAQILKLMKDLRDREGTAIMMITHDLGVIAETCDTVTVMYAGRVVETASVTELFANPKHAYTRGLIACTPSLSSERKSILPAIPGQVANPSDFVEGCRFCQRMERTGETLLKIPDYKEISSGHWVEMCPICLDENEDRWE